MISPGTVFVEAELGLVFAAGEKKTVILQRLTGCDDSSVWLVHGRLTKGVVSIPFQESAISTSYRDHTAFMILDKVMACATLIAQKDFIDAEPVNRLPVEIVRPRVHFQDGLFAIIEIVGQNAVKRCLYPSP